MTKLRDFIIGALGTLVLISATVSIASSPDKHIRSASLSGAAGLQTAGGQMFSGAVLDMNAGYIYDSTDSLALGGVCAPGATGDVCIFDDVYTSGWVSSALIEVDSGLNVQDSQRLQFGDVLQYAMYYNTSGANAFYLITTDGDGIGTNQIVFYILEATDTVVFSGELEVDGVGSGASQQLVCVKADGNLGTCSGGVGGGTCTCG